MRVPSGDRSVLVTSLAALLLPAAPARAAEEAEVLEDEWLVVQMAGQAAGRGRTLVRRKGERIRTDSKVVISVSRLGFPIRVSTSQSFVETADGRPLRLRMVQDASVHKMKVSGRIERGKLALTSSTMGQERTKTIDWPDDAFVGYAMELHVREQIRHLGGEKGATFTFRTFSLEHDGFLDVSYVLAGEGTIDVLGTRVRATRFEVRGIAPGLTATEYRDENGVAWKQEMGIAGMDIVMLRATKEAAEESARTPASVDTIGDMAVDVDRPIARQFEVDYARYRLRLKDRRADDLTFEGPRQKVESVAADGSVVLRVRSVKMAPGSAPAFPVDPATVARENLSNFLQPTTYLQSDDPALAAKAREVVEGRAKDSYEAAKLLERWVFENVTGKVFDRGFASAKEVFRDRAGDCTEHAVLLAAMLRAVGIPSRAANGVTYMEMQPGEPQMFYHMWTEGWFGKWVPLDATLAGEFVDACHLRLSVSDMSEMSSEAGFLGILQTIGRLKVEVLEYTVNGMKLQPSESDDPMAPNRVEGEARSWEYGVTVSRPEGWRATRRLPGSHRTRSVLNLVNREASATIALWVAIVPPAASLDYAVRRFVLAEDFAISRRQPAKLGPLDGCHIRYRIGDGKPREAVVAVHKGTVYVLALKPSSEEGALALRAAATSFRIDHVK
jgi:hypothetical protein